MRNHKVKIFLESGLKCQGKREVQYIKELKKANKSLPKKAEAHETPFGKYTPDFEFPDKFIEIKSTTTFLCAIGLCTFKGKGKPSDLQFKKIQWVAKNIKPVDIIIYLGEKEAIPILDIEKSNVTITIKGGKLLVL